MNSLTAKTISFKGIERIFYEMGCEVARTLMQQYLAYADDILDEEMDVHTDYGTVHLVVSGNENATSLFLLHGRSSNSLFWYQTVKT